MDHRVSALRAAPGDDIGNCGCRETAATSKPYARVPVNGNEPIGPMPISPEMLSPLTLPV